jgi:hypothetical protein
VPGRSTQSLERMRETVSRDEIFLNPKYWKVWLVVAAIGLIATFLVAALFGIGPIEVLLLKEPSLAPFTIFDYVIFGYGTLQAARWLRSRHEQ